MATITTKYSIGETVFHASLTTERKQHPCPDCKGAKRWATTSPAGTEYSFACPRCAARFHNHLDLSLDYSAYVPNVGKLTIGSIQHNTATGWDEGTRYMCRETGVGSGTVYNESDLFPTQEEAEAAAQIKAAAANSETEWVVKLYNKSLEVSDYELESALMKKADDAKYRAQSMLYNLGDLFSRIEEASDKDEIIEAVSEYKEYDWARDKKNANPEPVMEPAHD